MPLIEPNPAYIGSYRKALAEFAERNVNGFWWSFGEIDDPAAYTRRIGRYSHRCGRDGDLVPASVFWLVEGDQFIGHVSVRHELNSALERHGGHIGYAIRPSRQREGFGKQILKLTLPRARAMGVESALITCSRDNLASRKIIEHCGGRLIDEVDVEGTAVLRFWVSTDL